MTADSGSTDYGAHALIGRLDKRVDNVDSRVDGLEAWRDIETSERKTLLKIARSTAEKVDELIVDTRAIRAIASDAKAMAAAALPQMRQQFASATTEIESQLRNAKGELQRLAKDAARSDDPKAIEAALSKYFEARELAAYRSWKKTISELAKKMADKLMWPLLGLVGLGVLHAIRLGWLALIHH